MNQTWRASLRDVNEAFYVLAEQCLDLSEQKRLATFKLVDRRKQYLLSRGLIRFALSEIYKQPFEYWQFSQQPKSPPILENPIRHSICISISHSAEWVIVALSDQLVGIDIEKIKSRTHSADIASRVFTPAQCKQLDAKSTQDALEYFYLLWTSKEALYKVEANDIKRVKFLSSEPWPLEGYHCCHTRFDDYMATLISVVPDKDFSHFQMSNDFSPVMLSSFNAKIHP